MNPHNVMYSEVLEKLHQDTSNSNWTHILSLLYFEDSHRRLILCMLAWLQYPSSKFLWCTMDSSFSSSSSDLQSTRIWIIYRVVWILCTTIETTYLRPIQRWEAFPSISSRLEPWTACIYLRLIGNFVHNISKSGIQEKRSKFSWQSDCCNLKHL